MVGSFDVSQRSSWASQAFPLCYLFKGLANAVDLACEVAALPIARAAMGQGELK